MVLAMTIGDELMKARRAFDAAGHPWSIDGLSNFIAGWMAAVRARGPKPEPTEQYAVVSFTSIEDERRVAIRYDNGVLPWSTVSAHNGNIWHDWADLLGLMDGGEWKRMADVDG